VDQTLAVGVSQGQGGVADPAHSSAQGRALEGFVQGARAVDQLVDQRRGAGRLGQRVHAQDPGVAQRGGDLRLSLEALSRHAVDALAHLQRDLAVRVGVARAIHHPHPAAAELAEQLEAVVALAGAEGRL
jgi:hypothetical protein